MQKSPGNDRVGGVTLAFCHFCHFGKKMLDTENGAWENDRSLTQSEKGKQNANIKHRILL